MFEIKENTDNDANSTSSRLFRLTVGTARTVTTVHTSHTDAFLQSNHNAPQFKKVWSTCIIQNGKVPSGPRKLILLAVALVFDSLKSRFGCNPAVRHEVCVKVAVH
uniref:Uncharacterized protein n=1 Tax=Schistocephalus solidus TaxID=70667 RepID=A0A0V0J1U6_SCHSO